MFKGMFLLTKYICPYEKDGVKTAVKIRTQARKLGATQKCDIQVVQFPTISIALYS